MLTVSLHYVVTQSKNERLQPRVHPQLGQDARHVVALRRDAYVQFFGDLPAVEAFGQRLEDLPFAGSELRYGLASSLYLLSVGASVLE